MSKLSFYARCSKTFGVTTLSTMTLIITTLSTVTLILTILCIIAPGTVKYNQLSVKFIMLDTPKHLMKMTLSSMTLSITTLNITTPCTMTISIPIKLINL